MPAYCVVGFGRVGSASARLLEQLHGIKPIIFDADARAVDRAQKLGFEAYLADVSEPRAASRVARSCDIVGTALPSRVAEQALVNLVRSGALAIVDVSYIRDPLKLRELLGTGRTKVFVDAGLAPGLSNMLAAYASSELEEVEAIRVYVGGIAAEPGGPLGIVASWSVEDLLEEYTRPAKAIIDGKVVELDPIHDATRVELPDLGVFEAMPTDGLRTLLETFGGKVKEMIEYTLRYPGHVDALKLLKSLELLGERSVTVHGCAVVARDFTAALLESVLPRGRDRVVLRVQVEGRAGGAEVSLAYTINYSHASDGTSTLALLTGAVHSFVMVLAGEGYGRPGLNKPEEIGFDRSAFVRLLALLKRLGVTITEERRLARSL